MFLLYCELFQFSILVYVLFLSLLFLTVSLEQGRPLENYLGIVSEY